MQFPKLSGGSASSHNTTNGTIQEECCNNEERDNRNAITDNEMDGEFGWNEGKVHFPQTEEEAEESYLSKKKQFRASVTWSLKQRLSNSNNITVFSSRAAESDNATRSVGQDTTWNDDVVATSSSSTATFVPPTGLEKRFQQLLTLHETTPHDEELNAVTQTEVDSLLYAKDMYEMSITEREQILLDIHGVAAPLIEETPTFVNKQRRALQQALLISDTAGKAAYSQAILQNARYVQSETFQLPFLRCEHWDPTKAATKMLLFLEVGLELFGLSKMCQPIRLKDLSKDRKNKALESGFIQLLPVRDVAGRAIIVALPMCATKEMEINDLLRVFFYTCMLAIEDIETQQKGFIIIGCNVGPQRKVNHQLAWHVHRVRQAMPLRTMAIHCCYDDLRMVPMMTVGMLVSGASSRVRFRAHYGAIPDIQYMLTSFGIPDQCLPVTDDGEPKIKAFRQWVKRRKQQEDLKSSGNCTHYSATAVVPERAAVLLGRGKPIHEHFGNMQYLVLLDHYQLKYEQAKKFEKMQVAQTVVDFVHDCKGRFLKQEGAGWIEVDSQVARDKVSHAFRTRRSVSLITQQSKPTSTTTTSTTKSTATSAPLSAMKPTVTRQHPSLQPECDSRQGALRSKNTVYTNYDPNQQSHVVEDPLLFMGEGFFEAFVDIDSMEHGTVG